MPQGPARPGPLALVVEVTAHSITDFSTNIETREAREACIRVQLDVSHFHIRGLSESAVFIWVSVDMAM